ncbi:unnamed protein product [Leptidea sinapis]|uniref:Uncharacterized protein n=1 Tax=Leptidea sinapis TaxID=189913 RepID=A0A5E4PV17_9NEOP|nr:unnamed protein product [Leptidea sinapis]
MSRLHNSSSNHNVTSNSKIIRHESSDSIGGKHSSSKLCSSHYKELPTVLNDYVIEKDVHRPKKITNVVKPKRTIKSIDTIKCSLEKSKKSTVKIRAHDSAPTISKCDQPVATNSHRQCQSSASLSGLKKLKEEIKAYEKIEKSKRFRNQLFESCGVLVDDVGQVTVDKAVQVESVVGSALLQEPETASQAGRGSAGDRVTSAGRCARAPSPGNCPAYF